MYFKNQMIKKIKLFNQKLNLNLSSKVFEPNLTTWSIVEACHKIKFNKKKKNFRSWFWIRCNRNFFKEKV